MFYCAPHGISIKTRPAPLSEFTSILIDKNYHKLLVNHSNNEIKLCEAMVSIKRIT